MGHDHCAWLAEDGSVWTSGGNEYGQLGLGDKTRRKSPFRVPNLPPISSVRSGCSATLCLDTRGIMWSFGGNSSSQLGLGDTDDRSSPHMIPGIPPVLSFSFDLFHTICLCEDGSIWVFGDNTFDQLGLGENLDDQSTPVLLPAPFCLNEIISVSCGSTHTLFLTSEGQVFSCGRNVEGQLGLGDSTTRSIPTFMPNIKECIQIACGGNMSCMVDSFHHLWVCGSHKGRQKTPLCIRSVGLIRIISVGYKHALCTNQSGELWGWGDPTSGEFGNGSIECCPGPILLEENIQTCFCLGYSSFIRNDSSQDFCCGNSSSGQLGLGNTTSNVSNQLSFSKFPKEFTMRFPGRKFSQKSARSALPFPK